MGCFVSAKPTGNSTEKRCESCGAIAMHDELTVRNLDNDKTHIEWQARNHLAPCGLPCAAGGVKIDEENAHYRDDYCPRCHPPTT